MTDHFFLVGIGGAGLSAIARFLKEKGYRVSGSDQYLSANAEALIASGIPVFTTHSGDHLKDVNFVIQSSAIPKNNPEITTAIAMKIPVYKRADILPILTKGQEVIAVAGTHGKTTTSAMIAFVLHQLGLDPSFIIGSRSKNLGKNAHYGSGKFFVIEADEYDNMFLGLEPTIGVVTNVEHEHIDFFPTYQSYLEAFIRFGNKVKRGGKLIVCSDSSGVNDMITRINHPAVITYGTNPDCAYIATDISLSPSGDYTFKVVHPQAGKNAFHGIVHLNVPGIHNVYNALATLAIVNELNLDTSQAMKTIGEYKGTARRFDVLGVVKGITIINDYAHHPTEIKAALQAAKTRFSGRKIWAVWQPHTYTRTESLLDDFLQSFKDADAVIISDVYASRERNENFSLFHLIENINHSNATYIPGLDEIAQHLIENLKTGDVLIVLSAGDAIQVSQSVLTALSKSSDNQSENEIKPDQTPLWNNQ